MDVHDTFFHEPVFGFVIIFLLNFCHTNPLILTIKKVIRIDISLSLLRYPYICVPINSRQSVEEIRLGKE